MERITLRQLRDFKHRVNPEERQGAYGLYFVRPLSIYLTFLALRLSLSANSVTVLQTIVGLIGVSCLASQNDTVVLAGLVLLQLGFVLDNVDGEVARIRKQVSLTGKYLDTIGHELVVPCMYFAVGVGTYFRLGHFESVIFGFLAALFSLRLDISTLYHEAAHLIESRLNIAFEYYSIESATGETGKFYRLKNQESPTRIIYAMFAYPAIMNIISLLFVVDLFVSPFQMWSYSINVIYLFLAVHGILIPLRRIYTIGRLVAGRETEKKYRSLINQVREKDAEPGL